MLSPLSSKDRASVTSISLRLIHTYGVDDPAGLHRPEPGTTGVERREEQPFGVWRCLDLKRKREGAALGQKINLNCLLGGAPFSSIYSGRGGEATLEEGAALGGRPRVSLPLVEAPQGGGSFLP